MKTGLESLDVGAPKITYSSNEGPKSPKEIQMTMADPLLEEEYEKYVFEMEEQGLQPMSFEEFERQARSGMNEGGVARIGFRFGGGYQGGATNQGGAGRDTGVDRGGASDRREQYSVTRTTTPRTQQVSVAPTKIADDRGTTEQNLNQARAVINAQLQPTAFNKYKNMIPYVGLASKIGLIPGNQSKFEKAIKLGLLRDRRKEGQYYDDDMITPEFFDTKEGENLLRDAGAYPGLPEPREKDDFYIPPIPAPTTTGLDTTDADADATTTASTYTPATDFNEYDVDQANKNVMVSLGVDPRMFAADGGRIGYAGGGITDLRQGYFLGKLVKKIGRGIKKVVKSPIGKAALLAAPFAFQNKTGIGKIIRDALFGKVTDLGISGSNRNARVGGLLNFLKTGKGAMTGIAALSSLPLLMPQKEENLDALEASRANEFNPFDQYGGVAGLRRRALAGNLDPAEFAFMRPEFYAANGGLAENRMAALNELYGVNNEEQKLSMGGSAGLPPITMASEGTDTGSFPDDESTGMAQATPTMPNQMPMRQPMMNPMMGRMNPMMARGMMNPMMGRGMPMMGRGMPMMGGRIGYAGGGETQFELPFGKPDFFIGKGKNKKGIYKQKDGTSLVVPIGPDNLPSYAQGGRIPAQEGGIMMASAPDPMDERNTMMENLAMEYYGRPLKLLNEQEIIEIEEMMDDMDPYGSKPMARPDRVMAQEGGLMDMGGMEKDYRNEGGFVAIGGQERADDVPARLSKNEFVFTADAVRNAGGGDIDKGAEIMENMMENLEQGGKVSKESQGLSGARAMFATQQRLGEVL